MRGRSTTGR